MHRASTVRSLRFTAQAVGKAVLAGLATCLLLAGCAGLPDNPPGSQHNASWEFPGPDNSYTGP
jgi:hypothetical protein